MNFKKSLSISLLIHAIPLFLLLLTVASTPSNSKPNSSRKTEFTPPPNEYVSVDVITVKMPQKASKLTKEAPRCDKWYGGVGLTHSLGRVTSAPEYYPAFIAGVRQNDFLLNDDLKGEVGTEVIIQVLRGNDILKFVAIRAKICYNILDEK